MRCFAAIALVAALFTSPQASNAQAPRAGSEPGPVVVVAAASLNRLVADVDTITATAERPDLLQTLKGLFTTFGNFEGMDRDKPFGALIYQGQGFGPQPEPVAFVPVSDRERFLKTVEFGPLRVIKSKGKEDRYELKGPDGGTHFRIAGGYAFFAQKPPALDRTFPDPARLAAALTERFDLAAAVRLSEVPDGLKQVLIGTMKGQAEARMNRETSQKNDAGTDEEKLRRQGTLVTLETVESLVLRAEEVVVGWKVSHEKKTAALEAEVVLKSAAETTNNDRLTSSPVASLDPAAPLRFSLSGTIPAAYREVLQAGLRLAERKAKEGAKEPGDGELIAQLLSPLHATAATGRVDFAAQLVGAPPGPFTLVGGGYLKEADGLASALPAAIRKAGASPNVQEAAVDAAKAGGVSLHRVTGKEVRPQDERLYGPKPSLLVGAGREAVWFAIGGSDAAESLGRLIDAKPADAGGGAPHPIFHLALNAGAWVAMADAEADDSNPDRQLTRDAFSRGRDGLRLDVTSTPTGAKLRLELDEGFLRLAGLAVARRVDRGR